VVIIPLLVALITVGVPILTNNGDGSSNGGASGFADRRELALDLSSDIDSAATEARATGCPAAQTCDISALTEAYERLNVEGPTLGSPLNELLRHKADLAMMAANGEEVSSKWARVNRDIAAELE
jgi:hypothetical protein